MAENEKVQGIINTIKELNVLELSQLVKALETEIWRHRCCTYGNGCCAAAELPLPPLKLKRNLNSQLF